MITELDGFKVGDKVIHRIDSVLLPGNKEWNGVISRFPGRGRLKGDKIKTAYVLFNKIEKLCTLASLKKI